MSRPPSQATLPPAQAVAERILSALERYLHVEAGSGVALIVAAIVALVWANSPAANLYHHLWDAPIAIHLGPLTVEQTLHFAINDGLMTVFFLVVGMEIRREMHHGALTDWRVAALPLAAALGGVVVPAAIYLALVDDPALRAGWAVPTATDIAFAVGVLALLGKTVPIGVRMFLLTFAIVDDIAAILIIALVYSGGIDYSGLMIAGAGLLLLIGFQKIGIGAAYPYLIPGAVLWFGFLKAGLHPTLAGVVLGLLTPVRAMRMLEGPIDLARRALAELGERMRAPASHADELLESVKTLRTAQREMLPPVVRVQAALHPWVAYGVMPLFALANAGVSLTGASDDVGARGVTVAVALALIVGKPAGILAASWLAVRLRACHLPEDLSWAGVLVAGCLGGIGFTMSIFIATLAFPDPELLTAAKQGVLLASLLAGIIGYFAGRAWIGRARNLKTSSLYQASQGPLPVARPPTSEEA
jgi:NhaA family Na+:H+ antiporter